MDSKQKAREKRTKVVVPVKLWGTDPEWSSFTQDAQTVDISMRGARVKGVRSQLKLGQVIVVEHEGKKARFEVVWAGRLGSLFEGQIGIRCIEAEKVIWGTILPTPKIEAAVSLRDSAAIPPSFDSKTTTKGQRKRRATRFPCNGDVRIIGTEGEGLRTGTITDLSMKGCFARVQPPLPMGAAIQLVMKVADNEILASGIVRYICVGVGNGVEFLEISPDDIASLERAINALRSASSPINRGAGGTGLSNSKAGTRPPRRPAGIRQTDTVAAEAAGSQRLASVLQTAIAQQARGLTTTGSLAIGEETEKDDRKHGGRKGSEIPVAISFRRKGAKAILVEGKTVTISPSGAVISSPQQFNTGQAVEVLNRQTNGKHLCYVRSMEPGPGGTFRIAVAFATAAPHFWGGAATPAPTNTTESSLEVEKRARPKAAQWALASVAAVIVLFVGVIHWRATPVASAPKAAPPAVSQTTELNIPAADLQAIPDIKGYRLATAKDFDPLGASWLQIYGKQASGTIAGSYSGSGRSNAYVLIGRNNAWRVVIVADGQLRCDLRYQTIAIAARVPQESVKKIQWTSPPAGSPEGDGLLVASDTTNRSPAVVLFLSGDQVISGAPVDFRQVPVSDAQ